MAFFESEKLIDTLCMAVVGLGYVGLPLAVAFGKKYRTVGFDVKSSRINELLQNEDSTREVSSDELKQAEKLTFSSDPESLEDCNFYIVAVPTPINRNRQPDLNPLHSASSTVGSVLKKGDFVVYESTVYPGATEEVCVPILEREAGLRLNEDFFVGYSPERINPGDKKHTLANITKITSGSTPEAAAYIDQVYSSIIAAGTYKAHSIKVAEAAKVIENTQRDVNIALINELALIFARLGIDTNEVLEAAGTKWNFLPFQPGLVGGHCIGVDPYYLTYKAQEVGYNPEMILAGRRLNDNMGHYVVSQIVKLMLKKEIQVNGARILILGFTFKENCPDVRNTKVIDIVHELETYGAILDVHDPWADPEDIHAEYGITLTKKPQPASYDTVLLCVAHREFQAKSMDWINSLRKENSVVYDVKNVLPKADIDGRL